MAIKRELAYFLRLVLTLFVYGFTYMTAIRVIHMPECYATGLAAIMTLAYVLPSVVRRKR